MKMSTERPGWTDLEAWLLSKQIETSDVRYQDAATLLRQQREVLGQFDAEEVRSLLQGVLDVRAGRVKPLEEITEAHFDGDTYDPEYDQSRLSTQLGRVYNLMRDAQWRTLAQIAAVAGGSEAGVSARLRDLRKKRFGGYVVESMRTKEGGLWYYRLPGTRIADLGGDDPEGERDEEE